jgi:hypothetical protein
MRPKMEPSRRLSERVLVRLSPRQLRIIRQHRQTEAHESVGMSTYLRSMILRSVSPEPQ